MRWIWFASSASLVAISAGMLLTGRPGCFEVAVFGLIFLVEGLKAGMTQIDAVAKGKGEKV